MDSEKIENYKALLIIRRSAKQRDVVIMGSIFLISFLALIALGMLDKFTGRSLFLVAALVVCFGAGTLTTWVNQEILKGSIEMIDNLMRMNEE